MANDKERQHDNHHENSSAAAALVAMTQQSYALSAVLKGRKVSVIRQGKKKGELSKSVVVSDDERSDDSEGGWQGFEDDEIASKEFGDVSEVHEDERGEVAERDAEELGEVGDGDYVE
nr:hypothetical protein B0A51_11939 [Rachicladosporium sp. CCFEE 5018]